MRKFYHALIVLASFTFFACSSDSGESSGRSKWILRWNEIAVDASGRDHSSQGAGEQLGPVKASRAMAIVHIAMADTVAAITGKFQGYHSFNLPDGPVSLKAAIAQAGRDTLVALFPSQAEIFNAELAHDLESIADIAARDSGIATGSAAAAQILMGRQSDGSEYSTSVQEAGYQFSNLPGRWRLDPLNSHQKPIGSHWYRVRPFVALSADQFRAPPPPALSSEEYAAAFEEVRLVGGDGVTTPTIRTDEQTLIGVYWAYDGTPSLCAPPRLYNQIAVQIIRDHRLALEDTARLLALINVALADAGIASWESKYFYDFWRPVTGIREASAGTGPTGAGDGNNATESDLSYSPLGAPASNLSGVNFTPPFPAYPSGHATFGAALFQTLRNFFGTDSISFSFVSDELNGVTVDEGGNVRPLVERSFSNLSEAEEENGQSRIYLGIHWSFDKSAGIEQGRKVADFVFENVFTAAE